MTGRATPQPPPRVPGFKGESTGQHTPPLPHAGTSARAVRQLNVRIDATLLDRYRLLLRDCEDAGITIAMTELVHALLHAGPATLDEVRALVRTYRRAHEVL